ncbi:Sugar (pentulose or hexulose) kinase [Cribrihabitans marinus]|uniref:Sugar (Pentulose or hexulose) kinase n=1 Tax=Cribrihabitans marinus TaxID=1227549 RepID=A0A1H7E530_9RHOB|nr:FGGY-family carbohydrate kinase [Cribrihabitans marinus]GGH42032.1 carbohydrate kinase [Cribrihabitans marinus]SEK08187.1 Sugar (pentulose or hexulose) kinase [Cribrihabitans marinus]
MTRHVAVIDIGKTNAKLALVDRESLTEIAVITRPNTVLPGPPWPHFDVEGHWAFLLDGLRDFQAAHGIDAISITTHGACAALLDSKGELAAPILDYEFNGPDELAENYNAIRPPFSETGSPRLAGGLNIGAQLFWQFQTDPELKANTHQIVTYPQFWGAKLTGVAAMDVTSLGCHTDLWNPLAGEFSSLAGALAITDKLAPVRKPSDVLGTILPQIAEHTQLPPDTPVHCGIHDSNASLLPYVLAQEPPFSVISTGTWVIAMSIGGTSVSLDPGLDTLINVTALGDPAPSARFMGGREHDLASGGPYPEPTPDNLEVVLANEIMLMPALAAETGPFNGYQTGWLGSEPEIGTGERGAAVALYLALVTTECLSNIGHEGAIIVEGPFASNRIFLEMLAVESGSHVSRASGTTGTSAGAAMLASGEAFAPPFQHCSGSFNPERAAALQEYASLWKQKVQRRAQ